MNIGFCNTELPYWVGQSCNHFNIRIWIAWQIKEFLLFSAISLTSSSELLYNAFVSINTVNAYNSVFWRPDLLVLVTNAAEHDKMH